MYRGLGTSCKCTVKLNLHPLQQVHTIWQMGCILQNEKSNFIFSPFLSSVFVVIVVVVVCLFFAFSNMVGFFSITKKKMLKISLGFLKSAFTNFLGPLGAAETTCSLNMTYDHILN